MKYPFVLAVEATYPNYIKRSKTNCIKSYLALELDKQNVPLYILTNDINEYAEYRDISAIKVFDVNEIRIDFPESLAYETYPEDPTGIYPAKYPFNVRRFLVRQAGLDGFCGCYCVDADVVLHPSVDKSSVLKYLEGLYEPKTLSTNAAIFRYEPGSRAEVFQYHSRYIERFNLNYTDEQYNVPDGPSMFFMGETPQDLLNIFNKWNYFAILGYKKEAGYGPESLLYANLSFTLPQLGFITREKPLIFYPDHHYEDRYTSEYIHEKAVSKNSDKIQINKHLALIPEVVMSELQKEVSADDATLDMCFVKHSCQKNDNKYTEFYSDIFKKIKNDAINLLEIGVGTITTTPLPGQSWVPSNMVSWRDRHPSYQPGASLRAFKDFFKNGNIYGIDTQPDCVIREERINTFTVDSRDIHACKQLLTDLSFDIIIDDGDHAGDIQIETFCNLFPYLRRGGMYFIEVVFEADKVKSFFEKTNINCTFLRNDFVMIMRDREELQALTCSSSFVPRETSVQTEVQSQCTQSSIECDDGEAINVQEQLARVFDNREFTINGTKFADKGFYINLDKSVERNQHVQRLKTRYGLDGLERISALTDPFHQSSATKSQRHVFEIAEKNNYEVIFVAEDDFEIPEVVTLYNGEVVSFLVYIKKLKEELDKTDWDVFLFGCTPRAYLIPVSSNISFIPKSTGAWAYLIKRRAYNYFLKNFNYSKDLLACDDILPLLNFRGFKTLGATPLAIHHAKGFESTLQPRGPVNYDAMINGSYHLYLERFLTPTYIEDYAVERDVTLVITGHLCEGYLKYLRYLLYSLPDALKKCRILVYYDRSSGDNVHELIHYFYNRNNPLSANVTFVEYGLIDSIKHALTDITTPYFILLEHDWVFLDKNKINFQKLISAFEKYSFIHSVYFNKDDNKLRGVEICPDKTGKTTPFEVEKRVAELDLVTTCRWSNNPAMHRTSKYREWYNTYLSNVHNNVGHRQSDVEEVIIPAYREVISRSVWEDIRDEWGTFLYGGLEEPALVGHTDASRRYLGSSRSQPELNGDQYMINNPLPVQD